MNTAARAVRHIKAGDDLLQRRALGEAEAEYQNALRLDPASAEAAYSLGCVESHRGRYQAAADWARRALSIDPEHSGPKALLANCFLGLEDWQAAKRLLLELVGEPPQPQFAVQLGLCEEGLGDLPAAEARIRSALERFPSYFTRYQGIAMVDYDGFAADLHNHLARVLRKSGDVREAKLHYHLAKRCDATIELDPGYREIMSDAELEDHPYFDAPEQALEPGQRWFHLASEPSHEALAAALDGRGSQEELDELVALISACQREGELYLSARLRYLGDLLTGSADPERFGTLASAATRRLFEVAERLLREEISELQAAAIATALDFEPGDLASLIGMARRFVDLQPSTGIHVARALLALVAQPSGEEQLAVIELAAESYQRCGNAGRALDLYSRLQAEAEGAGRSEMAFAALRARAQLLAESGGLDEARRLLADGVAAARRAADPPERVRMLETYIVTLVRGGRHAEAVGIADELLQARRDAPGALPPGRARELLLAAAQGRPSPSLAAQLASLGDDGDLWTDAFEAAMAEGEAASSRQLWSKAADAYERAGNIAWKGSDWRRHTAAQLDRARALAEAGELDAAANVLNGARVVAERDPARINLAGLELLAATVALRQGRREDATQCVDAALTWTRRLSPAERRAEALREIALVAFELDQQRGVDLMGESFEAAGRPQDQPPGLAEGAQFFQAQDWERAVSAFETVLADAQGLTPADRQTALVNLASALFRLGRHDVWPARLEEAIAAAPREDRRGAAGLLARLATMLHQAGRDPDAALRRLAALADTPASDSVRRDVLLQAGHALMATDRYDRAEPFFERALAIAESAEWRDTRVQLECHSELGVICRRAGRYAAALAHYEQAISCASRLGDSDAEANLHGNRGIALRYLGRFDEAVDAYLRAIAHFEAAANRLFAATHRMNLGGALFALGRDAEAVDALIAAVKDFDALSQREDADRALAAIGRHASPAELPVDIARRVQALAGLESPVPSVRAWQAGRRARQEAESGNWEAAAQIFREVAAASDHNGHVSFLLEWIELALSVGRPEAATEPALHLECALGAADDATLRVRADELRLQLALRRGEAHDALAAIDRLRPEWRVLRLSLRDERDRVRFSDRASRLLDDYAARHLAAGRVGDALIAYDLGRSQSLLDRIMPSGSAEPFTLDRAAQLLRSFRSSANAVVVSFAWDGDSLAALTYSADQASPRHRATGMGRAEVRDLAAAFEREVLRFRAAGATSWRARAAPLLRAIASDVAPDAVVVFTLVEELRSLPLHAVPMPHGPLLVTHATPIYAPSLEILQQLATRPRKPGRSLNLVSIGVAFQDEALAILQRHGGVGLTGNHLSKQAVIDRIKSASICHFACHGRFDRRDFLDSGLILRNTETPVVKDLLSARDLLEADLDLDLAVLSACETGRGIESPSDFLGLGRAFLGAGARAVITTLWSVEDRATQDLMLRFYDHLLRDAESPRDAAQALRAAQLESMKAGASFMDWAGFQLTGWPVLPARKETALG